MMQVYLVGGAVRDRLLGLDVRERDWVVVGASAEAMRAQGYLQVGRDFPVFLHPQTHEEYALARTERKSGPGHLGFICYASPDVTLEQDLQRRDVTINAIAQADDGTLIDPYGGQRDLQQRWLRHIGPAFSEDPLRVLRIARFSACYAPFGFRVAPETHNLMRAMAVSGELDHLTAERIWKETEKALESVAPHVYFTTLHDCQALPILFPELMPLFNVPASIKGQYKLDTAWHPLLVLKQAATLSDDLAVRFAVLCRAFGATWAPYMAGLHHTLPTPVGIPLIKAFCKRLKVPNGLCELALLVTNVYSLVHQVKELSPQAILDLLNTIDVWRRPHRLSQVLLTYRADRQGYEGSSTTAYPQVDYLLHAYECVAAVDVQEIIAAGFSGAAIGKELQQQRLQTLQCWVQATSSTAE